MPRILLSACFDEQHLLRQTPGRRGRWNEFEFLTKPTASPVDGWTVYDNLTKPVTQRVVPADTLLITGEPESMRSYRARFTGQFGRVWTSHASIRHPFLMQRHEAQHWHYALYPSQTHGQPLGFDELLGLPKPPKTKLASVICSSKADSEDHRQRLAFVQQLKSALGDSIDVFGRGIRPIQDKSDAIYAYKYHIVLENDHSQHFMTEKLGDAFLGWSYPIYFGGNEADHQFPLGSFTRIDIYQPSEAIQIIRNLIQSETYERSQASIEQARHRVLHENNICHLLAKYWRENLGPTPSRQAKTVTLYPKNNRMQLVFRQVDRLVRRRTQAAA